MGEFNQLEYNKKFAKENYERIPIMLPKGTKEQLNDLAKYKEKSVNSVIIQAVERYYHINISSKPEPDEN